MYIAFGLYYDNLTKWRPSWGGGSFQPASLAMVLTNQTHNTARKSLGKN